MELQIALDRMPAATALDIVAAVAPHVDWIEVGTSMIKRDGAAFLAAVADAAGTPRCWRISRPPTMRAGS